jgi:hypothetical protein
MDRKFENITALASANSRWLRTYLLFSLFSILSFAGYVLASGGVADVISFLSCVVPCALAGAIFCRHVLLPGIMWILRRVAHIFLNLLYFVLYALYSFSTRFVTRPVPVLLSPPRFSALA